MSDISTSFGSQAAPKSRSNTQQPYRVEETHWGYIISATSGDERRVRIAQTVSMLIGACFLAAAISLWLWPALTLGVDALFMRYFATIVFGALAALFLWYASRGVRTEVQIDLSRGEIREVIRNKAGKMTLLGRYGFDSVDDVALATNETGAEVDLLLRYRNTGGCLVVASGAAAELTPLHTRISRDVIVSPSPTPDGPERAADKAA